jgi:Ribbon-helix-helix protein, copG family.
MGRVRKFASARSVLLRLPTSMIETLDEAARALNLCRSDIIRRSLARDLLFVSQHEVSEAIRCRQASQERYRHWLNEKRAKFY